METRCSLARCHLHNLCGMKECTNWLSSGWLRSAESQMASGSGGPVREEMIPTWIWKFLTRHRSEQESLSSKEPSTSDLHPRIALQLRKHRSPPQWTSDAMAVPASRGTHSSWPTPCLKAAGPPVSSGGVPARDFCCSLLCVFVKVRKRRMRQ